MKSILSLKRQLAVALLLLLIPSGFLCSLELNWDLLDCRTIPGRAFEECQFQQNLDHFSFGKSHTTLWSQRVLVNRTFYEKNGPVLFYCGNEGPITSFFDNSGFVTEDLARDLGALIIFAEHRYYGDSLPFGNNSFTIDNIQFLSIEQAMADYANLVSQMKMAPVIAVGGSYGGMLAAWIRLRYPTLFLGALAASAPILMFPNVQGINQFNFMDIVARDYGATAGCQELLKIQIENLRKVLQFASKQELQALSAQFQTCHPLEAQNANNLLKYLAFALITFAEVDYPYPTDFLVPVPASPVSYLCNISLSNQSTTLTNIRTLFSGSTQCLDLEIYEKVEMDRIRFNLETRGAWDFQVCTELSLPISSRGDFLWAWDYSFASLSSYCHRVWGVTPDPTAIPRFFGEFNASVSFGSISNIIFSNGSLDPWRAGGYVKTMNNNPTLVCLLIEGGAHHLDLRAPNPRDPASVRLARQTELETIRSWLQSYY